MINSFNGGEVSPRMHGRSDQAIYAISAAEMLNFVPTVEGPAMKRSGFAYIRAAMTGSTWLSPFIVSRTQAYVIEWGPAKLRFYTNGGRIETAPNVAYEVVVPYTAAQAPSVWYQQSYDRLYLAHRSHAPAALTRLTATTFAHTALTLRNGPFADSNVDEAITVTVTGTLTVGGNAIVHVAGGAPFLAGHVGSSVMIEAEDFSDIKAWEAGMDGVVVGTTIVRSDGKAYLAAAAVATNRTGSVQPTHSHGSEWDGSGGSDVNAKGPYGVKWTYLHDRFGIGTILSVGGGGTAATISVTRRIPASLAAAASHRWALAAVSAAAGWPGIVLLGFGRLLFFTDFELIASVVGDYGGGSVNMAPFTESGLLAPDMAFRKRLTISNPVLWAKADRDGVLIGTSDGEHVIRKINNADIFSSDNIECVPQSSYGSQPVRPVETGTSTLFVQKSGRKIREADYDLGSDRYSAANIAVWQRHILKSGAKQMTFQQEPEELVWAVRNDGLLALHPHVPEQEVKGFARVAHAAGAVLSAVAIPSEDGTRDELWALVDGGAAGKSVELQAPAWEEEETALEDAFFVDSGVSYDGAARNSFPAPANAGAIDHLAGKAVAVLADGGVVPGLTVSAGPNATLALPNGATALKCHVGLGYTARLRPLRPEARAPDGGTLQGKRKRLVSIVLRLLETVGIKVDPDTGHADQLIDRPGSAEMDAPVPPFTGDTSKSLGGNYGYDGQYTIISDDPLPCMVVAAMPTYTLGER
jgi:hypothetical protein